MALHTTVSLMSVTHILTLFRNKWRHSFSFSIMSTSFGEQFSDVSGTVGSSALTSTFCVMMYFLLMGPDVASSPKIAKQKQ